MANQVGEESLSNLNCPVCLDPFSDATNLSCAHTFCKKCLESYVEKHNNPDHIRCPVCREDTRLDEHGVEGLKPNFSLRALEDALHKKAEDLSSRKCSLHQLYNDIFCDNCEEFICLTCFLNDHKGHKIHKYEELERECKEQLHRLTEKAERRRTEYEEFLDDIEKERTDMHCHLISLDQEIRDSFAKKFATLQENEERLLKEVQDVRKNSDKQINKCIDHQSELIENFERSVRELTEKRDNAAYSDALKTLHLQCIDLDALSQKHFYEEGVSDVKRSVKSAKFCPCDEGMLALGRIDMVEGVVKQKADGFKLDGMVTRILQNDVPLNIAKRVDLPSKMCGMAALSSDEVVVGYGDKKEGAHSFSVSGEMKEFLDSAVGSVWDIAIQTEGRSVLSRDKNSCYVHEAKGAMGEEATCKKYKCKEGGWYVMLYSGHDDKIYAVNYNREIYIFQGSGLRPVRIVSTVNTRPSQICVTESGVMITSTCDATPSTVTVFCSDGEACSSLSASDDNEYLYAAVDSKDRLLVARVRGNSNVFRLSRYTLGKAKLIQEMVFNELTLPHCIDSKKYGLSYWCYMVSLTPDMLAFANGTNLYFIDLPTYSFSWKSILPRW